MNYFQIYSRNQNWKCFQNSHIHQYSQVISFFILFKNFYRLSINIIRKIIFFLFERNFYRSIKFNLIVVIVFIAITWILIKNYYETDCQPTWCIFKFLNIIVSCLHNIIAYPHSLLIQYYLKNYHLVVVNLNFYFYS